MRAASTTAWLVSVGLLLSGCPHTGPRPENGEPPPETVRAGPAPFEVPSGILWAYEAAQGALPALQPDERLDEAARVLARSLDASAELPDRNVWMQAVEAAGVAEPVSVVTTIAAAHGDREGIARTLRTRLGEGLSSVACNRVGLALVHRGATDVLVALVMASRLTFEPVPRQLEPGQAFTLRGRVLADTDRVQIFLAPPQGRVEVLSDGPAQAFDLTYELTEGGTYRVEILAHLGGSPVVLANFSLLAGQDRAVRPIPQGRTSDPEAARDRLWQLMAEERRMAGLPAVSAHPVLVATAQAYAQDMAARGFFGHVDPEGRAASDRVAARGLRPAVVLENLSRAPTAEHAHHGLLESPAHRRAMLAPDATHGGIGVFGDGENGLWVVEILARILPEVGPQEGASLVYQTLLTTLPDISRVASLDGAASLAVELIVSGASAQDALSSVQQQLVAQGHRSGLRALVMVTADLHDIPELSQPGRVRGSTTGVAVRAAATGGYHVVVLTAD